MPPNHKMLKKLFFLVDIIINANFALFRRTYVSINGLQIYMSECDKMRAAFLILSQIQGFVSTTFDMSGLSPERKTWE